MRQRVVAMIEEVTQGLKICPQLAHLGNPVLRQPTVEVSFQEGKLIAQQLLEILKNYRDFSGVGAGLAAPQIGITKSVFVTNTKAGPEIFINPKLINQSSQENFYRESCLSSRMMWSDTKRPESIELAWVDGENNQRQEIFSGFMARLIQHEYDHLLGICCLDKSLPGTIEYSGEVKLEKLR